MGPIKTYKAKKSVLQNLGPTPRHESTFDKLFGEPSFQKAKVFESSSDAKGNNSTQKSVLQNLGPTPRHESTFDKLFGKPSFQKAKVFESSSDAKGNNSTQDQLILKSGEKVVPKFFSSKSNEKQNCSSSNSSIWYKSSPSSCLYPTRPKRKVRRKLKKKTQNGRKKVKKLQKYDIYLNAFLKKTIPVNHFCSTPKINGSFLNINKSEFSTSVSPISTHFNIENGIRSLTISSDSLVPQQSNLCDVTPKNCTSRVPVEPSLLQQSEFCGFTPKNCTLRVPTEPSLLQQSELCGFTPNNFTRRVPTEPSLLQQSEFCGFTPKSYTLRVPTELSVPQQSDIHSFTSPEVKLDDTDNRLGKTSGGSKHFSVGTEQAAINNSEEDSKSLSTSSSDIDVSSDSSYSLPLNLVRNVEPFSKRYITRRRKQNCKSLLQTPPIRGRRRIVSSSSSSSGVSNNSSTVEKTDEICGLSKELRTSRASSSVESGDQLSQQCRNFDSDEESEDICVLCKELRTTRANSSVMYGTQNSNGSSSVQKRDEICCLCKYLITSRANTSIKSSTQHCNSSSSVEICNLSKELRTSRANSSVKSSTQHCNSSSSDEICNLSKELRTSRANSSVKSSTQHCNSSSSDEICNLSKELRTARANSSIKSGTQHCKSSSSVEISDEICDLSKELRTSRANSSVKSSTQHCNSSSSDEICNLSKELKTSRANSSLKSSTQHCNSSSSDEICNLSKELRTSRANSSIKSSTQHCNSSSSDEICNLSKELRTSRANSSIKSGTQHCNSSSSDEICNLSKELRTSRANSSIKSGTQHCNSSSSDEICNLSKELRTSRANSSIKSSTQHCNSSSSDEICDLSKELRTSRASSSVESGDQLSEQYKSFSSDEEREDICVLCKELRTTRTNSSVMYDSQNSNGSSSVQKRDEICHSCKELTTSRASSSVKSSTQHCKSSSSVEISDEISNLSTELRNLRTSSSVEPSTRVEKEEEICRLYKNFSISRVSSSVMCHNRLSQQSMEGDPLRLQRSIVESSYDENDDVFGLQERVVIPGGKKYRRSLSIIRHLTEGHFVNDDSILSRTGKGVRHSVFPSHVTCRSHRSLETIKKVSPRKPLNPVLDEDFQNILLQLSNQVGPLSFDELEGNDSFENCRKIGEGVYGEVFMMQRVDRQTVLKIIPIEGDFLVNGEPQKKYDEIYSELIVAYFLHMLSLRDGPDSYYTTGFAELVKSWIIKGRYPQTLIELWDEFNITKGSDNDHPKIFPEEQLYLVLELGNAGRDLESYSFSTANQSLSVFKQVVCALAVAEELYEFEHRDLHWGNILISKTSEKLIIVSLNGQEFKIKSAGVKGTIIDFTLSSMTVSNQGRIYNNIGKDPDMFIGTGDYQFEIYRNMKSDLKNDWEAFVPKTNVRWLHYLVDKMINRVKYLRPTAKVHLDCMRTFKDIESWILDCENTVDIAMRIINT